MVRLSFRRNPLKVFASLYEPSHGFMQLLQRPLMCPDHPIFGIFDSSISGIWLYGALRDRVRFFMDEDISRVGRRIDDKPIPAASEVPTGSTVFVPLDKRVAPTSLGVLHTSLLTSSCLPASAVSRSLFSSVHSCDSREGMQRGFSAFGQRRPRGLHEGNRYWS
jgi:hypothetical protein